MRGRPSAGVARWRRVVALDEPLRELLDALAAEHAREVRGASAGGRDDRPGSASPSSSASSRPRSSVAVVRVQRAAAPLAGRRRELGRQLARVAADPRIQARSKQPSMRFAGPGASRGGRRAGARSPSRARGAASPPPTAAGATSRAAAARATGGRATPRAARRTGRPRGTPARTRGSPGRRRTPRGRWDRRRAARPSRAPASG